ncbi:putative cytosol aminopeptidase [Paraoerskovia sediminicola]|uniref:Probable cytosol aminopeptidase n=1 Tax=Paraoerskovia sediminicola TaxID=1138587 RepID=A0ABM8G5I5_9CELL|nr:leucyl aminopeptidase [Paraoerskovia sediminicola]BDZ43299.1 putative cytosol aminopeptidase [Paraoerskovia sediminicola]
MADLTLTSLAPSDAEVDALVVGTAPTSDGVSVVGADLPDAVVAELERLADLLGLAGKPDEVHKLPAGPELAADILVLTGLGERSADGTFPVESLRRAAGAAVRALAGSSTVAIALPTTQAVDVAGVAEGALLGAYAYTRYRVPPAPAPVKGRKPEPQDTAATASPVPAPPVTIEVLTGLADDPVAEAAAERAAILADAVHGARDLINDAPNDLFPAAFAEAAKHAVKGTGAKVTVLDDKQLAAGGYGGLVGVGQGSARGPRLVKIAYTPAKPASKVALVGKGITFDSGGISIKPAPGMEAMKSDMSGAAAVLYTVVAAARLGLPVAVTGWLCLAENMPSGTAQRPSDVITIRGGKTVEVLNTDAEGRLVMADGLVAACEEEPDVVLDIATLTGAQMVALGRRVSGVMGDEAVRTEVTDAAEATGELFWAMPLPEELRATLKSKVADLANIGERFGGMLAAGVFLKEFVGDTPWAHLDIAGPAYNEKGAHGYTPVGGTGVGVRTLLGLLEARGEA